MTTPTESTSIELRSLLNDAASHATAFLEELPGRGVAPTATAEELRKELGGPLPDSPRDPRRVVAELARVVEPGLMATAGSRFFGLMVWSARPRSESSSARSGTLP